MDKNTMMEKFARDAYERGGFNGTWLYAENSFMRRRSTKTVMKWNSGSILSGKRSSAAKAECWI